MRCDPQDETILCCFESAEVRVPASQVFGVIYVREFLSLSSDDALSNSLSTAETRSSGHLSALDFRTSNSSQLQKFNVDLDADDEDDSTADPLLEKTEDGSELLNELLQTGDVGGVLPLERRSLPCGPKSSLERCNDKLSVSSLSQHHLLSNPLTSSSGPGFLISRFLNSSSCTPQSRIRSYFEDKPEALELPPNRKRPSPPVDCQADVKRLCSGSAPTSLLSLVESKLNSDSSPTIYSNSPIQ